MTDERFLRLQDRLGDRQGPAAEQERLEAYQPYFQRLGKGVVIGPGCRFRHPDRIQVDDGAALNERVTILGSGGVRVGRQCRIGPGVFIHSANHDLSPGPLAFHERGYSYEAVHIEDGCLLSANVVVLAGAQLGARCFVAAGAVVTRGRTPAGTRLVGVPARPLDPTRDDRAVPHPQVIVRAPMGGTRALRAVVEGLGLPQVSVVDPDEHPPSSAATVIEADPDGALQTAHQTVRVERAPTHNPAAEPLANALRLTTYYAAKRLSKQEQLTPREAAETRLAVAVLNATGEPAIASLLSHAAERHLSDLRAVALDEELAALLCETSRAGAAMKDATRTLSLDRFSPRTVAQAPELLWSVAIRSPALATSRAGTLLGDALPLVSATQRLVSIVALIAHLELDELQADAREALLATISDTGLLRTAPDRIGFVYSALACAALRPHVTTSIDLTFTQPWQIRRTGPDLGQMIAAAADRLVPPDLGDDQIELRPGHYDIHLLDLDEQIIEHLAGAAARASVDLLRVRPWPADRRSALSVRFDIDRSTAPTHATQLIRTMVRHLGAAPGSWYGIPGTAHLEMLRSVLERHMQEIGVHAQSPADLLPGVGSTWHSAPTSTYWRGQSSVAAVSAADALYGELLSAQVGRPREALLPDRPLVTPLHFPLEGSPRDTTLVHFDRLLARFRHLRDNGGHLIIGTHSDVNPSLLESLLGREDLADAWAAPVGTVVDRVQRLLAPGAVRWAQGTRDLGLLSTTDVTDVVVEHLQSGTVEVLDLVAGWPRPVFGTG